MAIWKEGRVWRHFIERDCYYWVMQIQTRVIEQRNVWTQIADILNSMQNQNLDWIREQFEIDWYYLKYKINLNQGWFWVNPAVLFWKGPCKCALRG